MELALFIALYVEIIFKQAPCPLMATSSSVSQLFNY